MLVRRAFAMILFAAALTWAQPAGAQSLEVRIDGDRLRVAVSKVRLLTGEPLQKLRDGATVTYVFRLSALSGRSGSVLTRIDYRLVISYDIFEEKFQVSRTQPSPRVVSHLSMSAAEAACMEGLELPLQFAGSDQPFWVRWEYFVEDSAETDSAINLGALVEIFSRKSTKEPVHGAAETGPIRVRDLPRQRGVTNP